MTERKYTLSEVTFCMGEALRGLDAGAEFPRLWRLFIEATVDKLKAAPVLMHEEPPTILHEEPYSEELVRLAVFPLPPLRVEGHPEMWLVRSSMADPDAAQPYAYEGKLYWIER